MKKVSVLVPIYNVAKYLPECLESLKRQTLKEIEFILLNDGSTDESPRIIRDFAKGDSRFVVVNKENSGYGDSMNQGLAKAKGEYIGILESDDFAEPDMFEKLYKLVKKHDADVARSNYFYHTEQGDIVHESIKDQPAAASLKKNHNILFEEPAIWSGLYRRGFLQENGIRFLPTPGASYQDTGFNIKALSMANKIAYTKMAYLHYRTDNSSSSVKSKAKLEAVKKEYAEIDRFFAKKKIGEDIYKAEQAAKFGAYHWNFQRVSGDLAKDFLKTIKQEFNESEEKGLLQKDFFPKKWWLALRLILKTPIAVSYILLSVRKLVKNR